MVAMRPLLLREKLEGPLLRHKAELLEAADSLDASRMLTTADDTTSLCLHEILLDQTTGRTLGGAMENLSLCAACGELACSAGSHSIFIATIFSAIAVRRCWTTDI